MFNYSVFFISKVNGFGFGCLMTLLLCWCKCFRRAHLRFYKVDWFSYV